MNLLEEIAQKTKERICVQKRKKPLAALRAEAEALPKDQTFPFEQALRREGISFICEIKKASPSKGVITENFPFLQIAKEYEKAGAAAISCLTEPYYFQGSDQYLQQIAAAVPLPVLRKDFTVDPYMIYQAKTLGACAVLLICALLNGGQLKEYLSICDSLGLSALVEAHTEAEAARAVHAGARIIGANNRDLRDFTVDIETSVRLRDSIPQEILFVSESGIQTRKDIERLFQHRTDAVLIGETLMRAPDKKAALCALRGDVL